MTVGNGESHHGDDVGHQEEDNLIVVVQQRLAGITIGPDLEILSLNVKIFPHHESITMIQAVLDRIMSSP